MKAAEEKSVSLLWIFPVAAGTALLMIAVAVVGHYRQDRNWNAPESVKTVANPFPVSASSLAAAKGDYADNCERCHGPYGRGDGIDASKANPSPTDFTDAKTMSAMTDGEIYWKITEGRLPMPTFEKILTDQQRWQLASYLRAFYQPAATTK